MLQSHLHFCPYIQCVCYRISKKTAENHDINSINSIFFFVSAPCTSVRLLLIITKPTGAKNCMWVEWDCSVFSAAAWFRGAAWAEIILREHSAGGVSGLLFSQARLPVPGLTSLEEKKCRGQMADWCSLCLKTGSYTLGSSCVQVYIQSHAREWPRRALCQNELAKLTRRKTALNWDLTERKWKRQTNTP